jgi:hypothetical protein
MTESSLFPLALPLISCSKEHYMVVIEVVVVVTFFIICILVGCAWFIGADFCLSTITLKLDKGLP